MGRRKESSGRGGGSRRDKARARPRDEGRRVRRRRRVLAYGAAAVLLLFIIWIAVRPGIGRTRKALLSTAHDHHLAGRHDAAADAYERAIGEQASDPPELRTFHDFVRCRIEAGRALDRAGRSSEATVLFEDTIRRLEDTYGPQALLLSAGLVLRVTTARIRRGDYERAYQLLERRMTSWSQFTRRSRDVTSRWHEEFGFNEMYSWRRPLFAALGGIAPALADPDDPSHNDAARILAALLRDRNIANATAEWLAEQLEEAPSFLTSLLPVFATVQGKSGVSEVELIQRTLQEPIRKLAGTSERPALEDSLVELVGDGSLSSAVRAMALDLLIYISDLPYPTESLWGGRQRMVLITKTKESLSLWREVRGMSRAEGHRRRVEWAIESLSRQSSGSIADFLCWWLLDHTGFRPQGYQSDRRGVPMPVTSAGQVAAEWRGWFAREGGKDPLEWFSRALRLDSTPTEADHSALLTGMSDRAGGRLAWFHFALLFSLPEDARGPVWNVFSFRSLAAEWRRSLGGEPLGPNLPYLTAGHLAVVDGNPEPHLVGRVRSWVSDQPSLGFRPLDIQGEFPGKGLSVRRALLGVPGLPYPRPRDTAATEILHARATLEEQGEGLILSWIRGPGCTVLIPEVTGKEVSHRSTSSYEGRPRLADVTEHVWPGPGGHGATHFTILLPLAKNPGYRGRTVESWRGRLDEALSWLAGKTEAAPAGAERKAVLERYSEDVEHLSRIATLIPIPDARAPLRRLDGVIRDEGMADHFPLMVCARLLAGDRAVRDEAGFDGRLAATDSAPGIGADFWCRVLLANRDPAVQEVALSRLKEEEISAGIGATLETAAAMGDFEPPPWLQDRVSGSSRSLRWGAMARKLPYYIGAGLLWIFAGICAILALRPFRARGERGAPASLLFIAGVFTMMLSLEVNGQELLPRFAGYGAAALGAGVLALLATGPLRFLTPMAFAAAFVLEWLLPLTQVGWGYPGNEQGLMSYAQSMVAALGICCAPFLSRSLDRDPRGVQSHRPSWRLIAFWVFCGVPLILRLNSWSHPDWVSTGRQLGDMRHGVGPQWVIPFAGWEGPAGILLSLAACLGIALLLWEIGLAARRRATVLALTPRRPRHAARPEDPPDRKPPSAREGKRP